MVYIMADITNEVSSMLQTAKVFITGRSQAVRLPLDFRFDVPEVFIRRDPITGDVVLSRKPTDWQGLLDVVEQNKDEDLLIERRPTQARRDPFEGWKE
jgi:antitoxin VapB